jgi:hypothetical protein
MDNRKFKYIFSISPPFSLTETDVLCSKYIELNLNNGNSELRKGNIYLLEKLTWYERRLLGDMMRKRFDLL